MCVRPSVPADKVNMSFLMNTRLLEVADYSMLITELFCSLIVLDEKERDKFDVYCYMRNNNI